MKKSTALRKMLTSRSLEFLMEAHNGVSAKIVEEAGFQGVWASSLTISGSMGVRDNNEASWTQILEVVEFMNDAVRIPILLDGDTGYGDFNNVRRLIRKLESRGIAGVCIEDKLFPKTNSLMTDRRQPLADMEEFCGKIKAAKDTQADSDFSVVARVEAFIAGWGLTEALRRAEAYRKAGADAVLIHSKRADADEIIAFMKEWQNRLPVVILPTRFYSTPTEVFEAHGISLVIWANHLLRAAIPAMQKTAQVIHKEKTVSGVEDNVATLEEVFRLQGDDELREAEKLYLPAAGPAANAVILAASRGIEFGGLTESKPKSLLPIHGRPLLSHLVDTFHSVRVKDITVVRGYKKELIKLPGITTVDNDDYATTQELYSLWKAAEKIKGPTVISYGDILFKKYILTNLLEAKGDIVLAVDADWERKKESARYTDYVSCDTPFEKSYFKEDVELKMVSPDMPPKSIHGEWIGLMKVTDKGAQIMRGELDRLSAQNNFKSARMKDLFEGLLKKKVKIHVAYIRGHWLDVDDMDTLSEAMNF